ncbi:MAG: hypothetical protein ACE5GB_10385 [Acidimicrobiales bacterium]
MERTALTLWQDLAANEEIPVFCELEIRTDAGRARFASQVDGEYDLIADDAELVMLDLAERCSNG